MGIRNLLAGKPKTEKLLKQAQSLLDKGKPKEAKRILAKVTFGDSETAVDERERQYRAYYYELLARAQLALDEPEAIKTVLIAHSLKPNEELLQEGVSLVERKELLGPEATRLVLTLNEVTDGERGFLLAYAKRLVSCKSSNLTSDEHELVLAATKTFTLWKGGSDLLAEEFLSAGRADPEAISVYRIAYPNRKGDIRILEKLVSHFKRTQEKTDFSAQVFEDYLSQGYEDPEVLGLLVQYYIEKSEITPQTIDRVVKAIQSGLLDKSHLEKLSLYILKTRKEFLDKKSLLLAIYRAGYYNKNVLAFLALAFAEEGNFGDEAIKAYEDALKNNLLTKRITLLLTEHFLLQDRTDEFACRVYEHYLSSWPERKQPRIYLLLSQNYMQKKRTDEQAQNIYEEALAHFPEFTEILPLLAASYLAYDARHAKAYSAYERAYPILDDQYLKGQIALLLAEQRIENSNFDRKTLEYIETALPFASERRRAVLIDARTRCYITLERRDPQALSIYLELYLKDPEREKENARLVTLLSDALIEPPAGFEVSPEVKMNILYNRFELERFGCPEKIAFVLLEHVLTENPNYKYRLHLSVRCFELDSERFAKMLNEAGRLSWLKDVGNFYLERFNYAQAAHAFTIRNNYEYSEENTYQVAKILIHEGKTEEALADLKKVKAPELRNNVLYWQAVAFQQANKPEKAQEILTQLAEKVDSIPEFLIKLRKGLNAELLGNYDLAVQLYREAAEDPRSKPFYRWLDIEIGSALFRKGDIKGSAEILREVYRRNPNGRAEQRHYSYVLLHLAQENMDKGNWHEALTQVQECIDANRNDRLLRDVAVELLLNYAGRFFFNKEYQMVTKQLEVAHQILPRDLRVKTLLAYSYHLLGNYAQALIYYRDITWSDETPMVERSQAYCYLANNQPQKAWKVFLDLKKRGNLTPEDVPLLIQAFLADKEALGSEAFKNCDFPEDRTAPIAFAAFYIHDGLYDRALDLLTKYSKTGTQELQKLWFLGKAASLKGDKKLAVAYWQQLLERCLARQTHTETKVAQLLEIGLAFLNAGYASEAMQTWEKLRELAPEYPLLPKLYAYTLDLNAYLLAQRGNIRLAIGEWEKAYNYDPDNTSILQNLAIAYMVAEEFDISASYWNKVTARWKVMVDRNPAVYAHLSVAIGIVSRLLSDVFITRKQAEEDVYTAKTEEMVDYYQRANQFYWILGLNKRATRGQIERAYFRLIKIFNPERHPADFMLLEESYANLTDPNKREKVDVFVFNPVDVNRLRELTLGQEEAGSIFEQLGLSLRIPAPDFSHITPPEKEPREIIRQLSESLKIYLKLGDQSVI